MDRFKNLKSGHRLKKRFGVDILLEVRNSESKVKKPFKISNKPSGRITKRKKLETVAENSQDLYTHLCSLSRIFKL